MSYYNLSGTTNERFAIYDDGTYFEVKIVNSMRQLWLFDGRGNYPISVKPNYIVFENLTDRDNYENYLVK